MRLRRRSVLAGSTALVASVAGCGDLLPGDDPTVSLKLFNYTDETQPIRVELLRRDGDEYSEARAFAREYDVPPPEDGDSAGEVAVANVAERRPYLLRALLKYGDSREWSHHHFYPGESSTGDDSERLFVRVYRDETSGAPYVEFM